METKNKDLIELTGSSKNLSKVLNMSRQAVETRKAFSDKDMNKIEKYSKKRLDRWMALFNKYFN